VSTRFKVLADDEVVTDLPSPENVPTATFLRVTPQLAEHWLAQNTHNRPIIKAVVERYKRDMMRGRWHLEGSPIKFSPDGTLLDGQQRLTAVVQTGISQTFLVVKGIETDAQIAMDTGRKRTAGDALAINGFGAYSTRLAAVARLYIEAENDSIDHGKNPHGGRFEVSHDDVFACLAANPDIEDAVRFAQPLLKNIDVPSTLVAYTYLIMRRIDALAAEDFWLKMSEKTDLAKGDPVIALTHRLADSRRRNHRLTRRIYLSLIYRAWNARHEGRSMHLLRINSQRGVVPIPTPR